MSDTGLRSETCDRCENAAQILAEMPNHIAMYQKYEQLLSYVKDQAYPKDNDPAWIGKKYFQVKAKELLKELGE